MSFGWHNLVYWYNSSPRSSQPSEPSHPSWHCPPSQPLQTAKQLGVGFRLKEGSESMPSLNHCHESIVCLDRRCICNSSGILWPYTYEGPLSDSSHLIVVKNSVRLVFVPGLMTCFDEPVRTIDWLCPSLRCHVGYVVAASCNPQPRDDILYKHSVKQNLLYPYRYNWQTIRCKLPTKNFVTVEFYENSWNHYLMVRYVLAHNPWNAILNL